jgi:hypothetical protein
MTYETDSEDINQIESTQDLVQWQAFIVAVMRFQY